MSAVIYNPVTTFSHLPRNELVKSEVQGTDASPLMQPPRSDTCLGSTRRRFYVGAIYGVLGIITGTLGTSAVAYLFIPPARRSTEEWVDAGELARLKPNLPIEIVFRRMRIDGWRILSEKSSAWVTKSSEGIVTAFGPQCTHLGCAYHWDTGNEKFICPCHSSVFSIKGEVQSGPAPRPLDRYETKIENGRLMLGRLRVPEANGA